MDGHHSNKRDHGDDPDAGHHRRSRRRGRRNNRSPSVEAEGSGSDDGVPRFHHYNRNYNQIYNFNGNHPNDDPRRREIGEDVARSDEVNGMFENIENQRNHHDAVLGGGNGEEWGGRNRAAPPALEERLGNLANGSEGGANRAAQPEENVVQQPENAREENAANAAAQPPEGGSDNEKVNALEGNHRTYKEHTIDGPTLEKKATCPLEISEGLRVLSVRDCQSSDYATDPTAPEHTGVVGVMLSIKTAPNKTATTVVQSGGSRFAAGGGSNRRYAANTTDRVTGAKYDRVVTLADCQGNAGACFAVMNRTKKDSDAFFETMRVGKEGMGDIVLLEELNPVDDNLGTGTDLPLVHRVRHVLPLNNSAVRLVPEMPIITPKNGDTKYFCQHHVKTIQFGHAVVAQAICGGSLCDRQDIPTAAGQACGCFYKWEKRNPLVIEMSIRIPVPTVFDARGLYVVSDFRSFRTSRLLVAADCWSDLDRTERQHEDALRVAVRRIANYINGKGGWTYVGWLRTGTVADESETANVREAENITSLTQNAHISYLLPSDPSDVADSNDEFQRLRLQRAELH